MMKDYAFSLECSGAGNPPDETAIDMFLAAMKPHYAAVRTGDGFWAADMAINAVSAWDACVAGLETVMCAALESGMPWQVTRIGVKDA